MRAAVYLRQSLDRDGNELAVSRQLKACLALCDARGWTPTVVYEDNDTSATSGKPRPAYQCLLRDIESGRIDAIIVWDLDRLHRRPIELESFMKLADSKGLKLATVTGDVDLSTDNGRLFARIKGAVGMAEIERKSARQKAAATQHAEAGHPWWRCRPFGFDADPGPDGRWSNRAVIRLHPTEADLVRAAYADVRSGGSINGIATAWTKAGVTTPGGAQWRASSVRALLLAPRNAGLREHLGTVVGPGTWPAIVKEELWRSVVAKLSGRKGRPSGGRKRLLTGIAVCGLCGHSIGSGITHGSGRLTYVCKNLDCRKISRAAEPVDAMVIEAVVRRLSRPDAIELTRRDAVDTDELRSRRDGLRDQQAQLGREYAEQNVSHAAFLAADRRFSEQLAAIDAELTDHSKAPVFDGVVGFADVDVAFDALPLDRRRAVIDALVSITIKPAGRGARKVNPQDVDIEFR